MRWLLTITAVGIVGLSIILIPMGAFVWWVASNEAAAFNKFKAPDTPEATAWDALFIQLRVEAK